MDTRQTNHNTVLVVIPTYNEIDNLVDIVSRTRSATPEVHVLVVDDASPDGTGHLADELAGADEHVHVLHRQGKEGLGRAYVAGFRWGISQGFQTLVEMDADGSHRPEQLERLLAAVDVGADFVIGSRWVRGGAVHNWPFARRLLSQAGSMYARLALGIPVRDVTGGYRAITSETLQAIGLDSISSAGFCFQIDMARRALATGRSVTEVPIDFADRVHGESKLSRAIVIEAFLQVTRWGLQSVGPRRGVGREMAVAR